MKTQRFFSSIAIASIAGLIGISVVFALVVSSAGVKYTDSAGANRPIGIIGSCRIDGGEWREFAKDVKFNTDGYRTVTVKGRFSRDIPAGQSLLLYIPRLSVSLLADGAEVYAFNEGSYSRSAPKMAGTAWAGCVSPGISADTEIEITMRNAYRNTNVSFNALLDNMQTGSRAGLYGQMFTDNGGILAFGMFFIFIGVMALILAAVARFWRVPHASKPAALAFFAVVGAANFLCDLNYLYMPLLIPNPVAASVFDIMPPYLIACVFAACAVTYVGERIRRTLAVLLTAECLIIAGMIALQLFGAVQLYEAQPVLLFIAIATLFTSAGLTLYDALKFANGEARLFLLTMLPGIVGAALDTFNYFFPVAPPRVIFALGLSITLVLYIIQVIFMIKRSSETALRKQKLETEQARGQIAVMLSQIKPHFLFNSLIAIQELCLIDPTTAHEAIGEFSQYLRGNVDSLSGAKPVPFDNELHHVKNYLALEKKRFGGRLRIVYDIPVRDFTLPALTLQPIAENAVRHGVMKREGGGEVVITTAKCENGHTVTVTDDGVGFDPGVKKDDGRVHVGIENVRHRLAAMSNGTLEIRSEPGVGTTVVIAIPD